jgi:hypothetical protein
MSVNTQILSLKDILNNESRELPIEGIGTVKVRFPTVKDRIDSREEAKKDSRWLELTDPEKNSLVLDLLALKMIVEPKISLENYYDANNVLLSNIINAVIIDYTTRFQALQDKRKKEIQTFLDLMKESNL